MIIDWQVINHDDQKYETVGNWWWDGPNLNIRVSRLSNARYEWLIGIHELIEVFLCKLAGVNPQEVDEFDERFEESRAQLLKAPLAEAGWYVGTDCGCTLHRAKADQYEPGDDPHAPYHRQHMLASAIERLFALWLGVDWQAYELEVQSLCQTKKEESDVGIQS